MNERVRWTDHGRGDVRCFHRDLCEDRSRIVEKTGMRTSIEHTDVADLVAHRLGHRSVKIHRLSTLTIQAECID